MKVDEVLRSVVSRAGVVRVRNAMNPLLWLSSIAPAICWIAAYVFRDDPVLRYALASLGAVPILASVVAYFLYLAFDRDRLQSEEFILRQHALKMVYRKGADPRADDESREIIRIDDLSGVFGNRDEP